MAQFSRPMIAMSLADSDEGLLHYSAKLARWLAWTEVQFAHVAPLDRAGQAWGSEPFVNKMREFVQRTFSPQLPRCRNSYHVMQGSRLDQIVGLAVEHERDLIVLGHRRERSGRRSLARRLAMVSPSSVWLVPEGSPPEITTLLVPTDFSTHSADALSVAVQLAQAGGMPRCYALHVFFDPSTIRYDEHVDEVLGGEQAAFDRFLAGVDLRGVEVEPLIHESTHPSQEIIRVAERYSADLIVMNTRGRSHAASVLLGSVTSDTMAATTVPVLAVKHYGDHLNVLKAILNHRFWERPAPKSN